jgi:AAA domain (dynein-related subfamily)
MTGKDLIDRVVRAIELDQSVVLSGPRGCGKSYCIEAAIAEAMRRGVIKPGQKVFLQGNREIPRDYLAEDEIGFRVLKRAGTEDERVLPYLRPAPLFRRVTRDPVTGDPVRRHPGRPDDKWVVCEKFVLFLDEINRFSDGVLDSLLSVLEERKAVLAGEEYRLPVVVCMTMNPPGYDGSARRLSPPLAARIGRSYRLYSPDLDTLGDEIITSKLATLRAGHMARRATGATPELPEFPITTPETIRKVALVTLCLWGDVTQGKAGNEYLHPRSQAQIKGALKDPVAGPAMRALGALCQFGPDGRAGADWMTTAIGLAIDEAVRNGRPQAVLLDTHLIDTVVESVAHKIYDNFSPGARPDLTEKKEKAVKTICQQVFNVDRFRRIVARKVDDLDALLGAFQTGLVARGGTEAIRRAFITARVTDEADVQPWLEAVHKFLEDAQLDILEPLERHGLLFPADSPEVQKYLGPFAATNAGFRSRSHDKLARIFAGWEEDLRKEFRFAGPVHDALGARFLNKSIGSPRRPPREELADFPSIRAVGLDAFWKASVEEGLSGSRGKMLKLARDVENLWGLDVRDVGAAEASFLDGLAAPVGGVPVQHHVPALLKLLGPLRRAVDRDRPGDAMNFRALTRRFEDSRFTRRSGARAAPPARRPGK